MVQNTTPTPQSTTLRARPRLDDRYCATMPRRSSELKDDRRLSLPCPDFLTVARSSIDYPWPPYQEAEWSLRQRRGTFNLEAKNRKSRLPPISGQLKESICPVGHACAWRSRATRVASSLPGRLDLDGKGDVEIAEISFSSNLVLHLVLRSALSSGASLLLHMKGVT